MPSALDAIASCIENGVVPRLIQEGFKKKGREYHLAGQDFFNVVAFQSSQSNTRDLAKFTLNLGVSLPTVEKLLGRSQVRGVPKECECTLRTRIGSLLSPPQDKWWMAEPNSDVGALAASVLHDWEVLAKPWLEAHRDLRKARSLMEYWGMFEQSVAVSLLLGERDYAQRVLTEGLAKLSHNPSFRSSIARWAKSQGLSA